VKMPDPMTLTDEQLDDFIRSMRERLGIVVDTEPLEVFYARNPMTRVVGFSLARRAYSFFPADNSPIEMISKMSAG
jgi:hypothetical protein